MWIFVFFDLPVKTKKQRKNANEFRKMLLRDGFHMFQLSVYTRPCFSKENTEVHMRRIQMIVPDAGKVSILSVTDKQFSLIRNLWGDLPSPPTKAPEQLLLF
jgi:CRISPR-associated protein Cas2